MRVIYPRETGRHYSILDSIIDIIEPFKILSRKPPLFPLPTLEVIVVPLEDDLRALAGRIPDFKDRISTEEATKQSLVLPFLQALGYNVFDPTEIEPEFTADVGIKQGEKVDYAVMSDGEPVILMECKKISDNLTSDHRVSQLYRYFGATQVRIGVLTNGVIYRFFSDLESPNVMDTSPFLEVDLEHLDARAIERLGRFTKGFDVVEVVEAASRLRYIHGMKQALIQQYNQPEEDFVDWLGRKVYSGRMTQAAREMLSNLTRRALHEFVNDRISDTLQAAQNLARFQEDEDDSDDSQSSHVEEEEKGPKIITTAQELQAYDIVKDIAKDIVEPERVHLRDSQTYCAILLDNSNRRPLCRLHFQGNRLYVGLFDGTRYESGTLVEDRLSLDSLNDIYLHAESITETLRRYLES